MKTFRRRDHVSLTPKMWTAPNGTRIEWRSDRQTFDAYLAVLNDYYAANNLGTVDAALVEDTFCRQMPKWVCADAGFHTSSVVVSQTRGGCSSCGRRR